MTTDPMSESDRQDLMMQDSAVDYHCEVCGAGLRERDCSPVFQDYPVCWSLSCERGFAKILDKANSSRMTVPSKSVGMGESVLHGSPDFCPTCEAGEVWPALIWRSRYDRLRMASALCSVAMLATGIGIGFLLFHN